MKTTPSIKVQRHFAWYIFSPVVLKYFRVNLCNATLIERQGFVFFDIHLDDGKNKKTFSLNRSYRGLLVTPMIWRVVNNFSSGAVCLVLASERYDEADYIRDYTEFKELTK